MMAKYTNKKLRKPRNTKIEKKVNALARRLGNLPKPELKYLDNLRTSPANIGYDISTVTDALCTPSQGDTNITREGSTITMQKLHIKGRIIANSAQAEPYVARVMLIQSKQRYVPSSIATSGVTQLLENANTNDAVHSMFSFTNRVHYRVLRDFKMTIQSTGTSGGSAPDQRHFSISYKFKKFNKTLRFDGTSTTSQMNQVYLVVIATAGTTNYPTIEYAARTTFYDN